MIVIKKIFKLSFIKDLFKSALLRFPKLVFNSFLDSINFIYFEKSGYRVFNYRKHNQYKILEDCHAIEKSLISQNFNKERGKNKIIFINKLLESNKDLPYSKENFFYQYASDIVEDWNKRYYENNTKFVYKSISKKFKNNNHDLNFKKFCKFVKYRNSVRSYESTIVPTEIIEKLIKISQFAPSQCNRQSVKIHVFQNYDLIQKLLKIQSGCETFRKDVHNLAVLTSDLSSWDGSNERNQPYIDGGIFLMMFLLSLESFGLASCSLNLALNFNKSTFFKNTADIPSNETLISAVSFGFPKEISYICSSRRVPIKNILKFH